MLTTALLLSLCFPAAQAAAGDPLLDLTLQGYGGGGYAVSRGVGADIMGRAGGALTGWVTPRVGLGVRADTGSYGLLGDDPNTFAFAEGRYRLPDQDLAIGLGVGTPIVWVEYACFAEPCIQGPWEYHNPVFTGSLAWEQGLGRLHLPVALRLEASAVRLGLGVDVGLGWRFVRR